jgi:hypothetical protein
MQSVQRVFLLKKFRAFIHRNVSSWHSTRGVSARQCGVVWRTDQNSQSMTIHMEEKILYIYSIRLDGWSKKQEIFSHRGHTKWLLVPNSSNLAPSLLHEHHWSLRDPFDQHTPLNLVCIMRWCLANPLDNLVFSMDSSGQQLNQDFTTTWI